MSASYFSHDSNARNSKKLLRLRQRHGAAGYGVYFMILERLRDEEGYRSDADYDMIAFDLHVEPELIRSVVEDFSLFELSEDGTTFHSCGFDERMEIKDQKSTAGKKGAEARWGNKENTDRMAQNGKTITETDSANAKKSKEKKSKENYSSSFPSSLPSDGKIEAEEKQQEEFLSILFFRNYVAPSRELQKFIAYNNTGGRDWDKMSYKERRSALDLWKQEPATKRVDDQFLLYWQAVFKRMLAIKAPHEIIIAALDDRVNARMTNGMLILDVPDNIRDFIERNLDHFKAITHDFMRKKKLQQNTFTYHILP